jgi:hypothetical protein
MKNETKIILACGLLVLNAAVSAAAIAYKYGYEAAQTDHVCLPTKTYNLDVRLSTGQTGNFNCEEVQLWCQFANGGLHRQIFKDQSLSWYSAPGTEKADERD